MKRRIDNLFCKVCLLFGFVLRLIVCIGADPTKWQHDVMMDGGHFHYACHIFSTWGLPNSKYGEFYQPPLNAFMQAICMKFTSIFVRPNNSISSIYNEYISGNYKLIYEKASLSKYMLSLYSITKILPLIYTTITFIIIYCILESFDLKKSAKNFIVLVSAIYPGMILMAGQYNNDPLSYLFFFLSILLAIKWCRDKKLKTIILLALSIGLGMLTKISVGLIALIIGPMMLIILIKEKNISKKQLLFQLLIFALIVFPLGLSYALRNYVMFQQPFNYVRKLSETNPLYVGNYSIVDRVLSFPFDRMISDKTNIYHDQGEYNIWIDLIKTATFDEYINTKGDLLTYILNVITLYANMLFIFISIVAFVIVLVREFLKKNSDVDLVRISIMLFILALVSYIGLNLKYPASCTSNYRYVMYVTFAGCVIITKGFKIFR